MAFGAGGEFRAPMAIAVIGGLIVSTLLSLVFVPAFFAVMDDLSRLFPGLSAASSGPPTSRRTSPSCRRRSGRRLGNHVVAYPARTQIAAE